MFGGDCISPPFFCIYIKGNKFIYCNTLAYMLNIFYIAYLSIHLEPIGIMFNLKYCSKL